MLSGTRLVEDFLGPAVDGFDAKCEYSKKISIEMRSACRVVDENDVNMRGHHHDSHDFDAVLLGHHRQCVPEQVF